MTLPTINLGSAPNDGTGDPLRTALGKANQAIAEVNAHTAVLGNDGSPATARVRLGLGGVPVNYTDRGTWATATAYAVNDLVRQGGYAYVVLTAHTSGTFSTDLAAGKLALHQGITREELSGTAGALQVGFGSTTVGDELTRIGGVVQADGTIDIGTEATTSVRDAVLLHRAVVGTTDCHGFRDETAISGVTDYGGYGSVDVAASVTGAHHHDHVFAFQARQDYKGSGYASHWGGLYAQMTVSGPGYVERVYAVRARDPLGTGVVNENSGIVVEELTRGTVNYAIVTEGNTPSIHGGRIIFGANEVPSVSQGVAHKGARLTGAGQESFYASGVGTGATTYYAGFASFPAFGAGASNAASVYGVLVGDATIAGSATIGTQIGVQINNLTRGGAVHGIHSDVSSGAAKWALYLAGDAKSYIAGKVGVGAGTASPTAQVHVGAGTTAAGTAPLKLAAGTLMATPENGAIEFDGTFLYFTVGGVRKKFTLA